MKTTHAIHSEAHSTALATLSLRLGEVAAQANQEQWDAAKRKAVVNELQRDHNAAIESADFAKMRALRALIGEWQQALPRMHAAVAAAKKREFATTIDNEQEEQAIRILINAIREFDAAVTKAR